MHPLLFDTQLQADRQGEDSFLSSECPSPMSLVSRAKTAIHSAAKAINEIKADLTTDRGEIDGPSLRGARRSSEPALSRAYSCDKLNEEVLKRDSTVEEVSTTASNKVIIPPASVIKQLAAAFEGGKKLSSISDLSTISEDPSSIKEKASLKFSVVKSIVRRAKEDKYTPKAGYEEFRSLIHTLFDAEEQDSGRRKELDSETISVTCLSKDIRGAPPESFTVRLSEIIGGFKSLQNMASFWGYIVVELRRRWNEGQPVPHMPLDEIPDLNSCLLHQQLQVINCCIARKRRRLVATESLDSILKEASLDNKDSVDAPGKLSSSNVLYARINSGEYVLRLGVDHLYESLTMLETGEPIYSPMAQEGPVLTEELIKENEEFVLRTGSVGAGCSQLLSDMQAFKAANPGCILEDFVRWHSPPDWTDVETDGPVNHSEDADGSSRRGQLSARMQKEGNLWRELWESAKPLPAISQAPLYDEDLAVDGILTALEDIHPCELFEQLLTSVLVSSFLVAEPVLPHEGDLSKLFHECKEYVIATCQTGISSENIADICKVYETIEMIVANPEEALMITEQPEEPISGESKSLFKKINLNFIRDRPSLRRKTSKHEKLDTMDVKKPDEKKPADEKRVFSSLFSRKSSKSSLSSEPDSLDGSDWTIV